MLAYLVAHALAAAARVLQYLETPPYLRSTLIPGAKKDEELSLAAALPPIGAAHHLKDTEWLPYREGVVLKSEEGLGSYVDVGLDRMCHVKEVLPLKARVTVHLGAEANTQFLEAYSETMLIGQVRGQLRPLACAYSPLEAPCALPCVTFQHL